MFNFFKKKAKKDNVVTKALNPAIAEGFLNDIDDIVCIANYDGTIETINNFEKNEQYKTLKDLLFEMNNKDTYQKIIDKIIKDGVFNEDVVFIDKDNRRNRYIIAYNMASLQKMFFYIKDMDKYYNKEQNLIDQLDRQNEYLKSKDLFIANLSHEIKTPINIIVGMIYFLKDTHLNEDQIEYVKKLDDASNLLLEMVNGILDLSKSKEYSGINAKVDFNLKAFLDNIIDVFEEKLTEKDLKLYVNLNFDADLNIYADKSRLNQVFVNLLGNAIKYTDKGFIELDARKVEETSVSYTLQFCLKDTGMGIKREDTLKIFREFSQVDDPTRKVKDGKGMGLAIAKKIVEDMNGKMWVESSMGLGSKFYFNITVEKSNRNFVELEENSQEENILVQAQNKEYIDDGIRRKVLLVEDNELNVEITKKIVEEMNYTCDVAPDGLEAIKKIKEVGIDYFDIILMDIHMPKYNGYEISKILKTDMGVKTPIVALTATTLTNEIMRENSEYILDFIQKPFKPADLQEKIKRVVCKDKDEELDAEKKHLLLLGESTEQLNELKEKLLKRFDVAITTSEVDATILLETGVIDGIVVDEFENLDKQFSIINQIKCDKTYCTIPIILIHDRPDTKLEEMAATYEIKGIIKPFEIARLDLAVKTKLDSRDKEEKLEEVIEKTKEETENVYNFLFESMVNLTTSKSKETGEHLMRTKEDMKIMLKKYEEFYQENLFTSNEIIEDIAMAAVLHDIGKVGIPDNILNKNGRLTDEEYEIIKTHVVIGRNILESTYGNKVSNNILDYAKDIVYHHHEKYDGTGYPEKLKGEEISVISRIMSLIDVYDALANDRVYKKAMPYEEVEEFIKSQSGKSFDPKIVNVFSLVKDDLKKINEENKDILNHKPEDVNV